MVDLGNYDFKSRKAYGVRDVVLTVETSSSVHFSLSRSLRGLGTRDIDSYGVAIVFDEKEAKRGRIGPFGPIARLAIPE
jgi:hypothetical protein